MTHYYAGRSGDSFTDAEIHTTDGCPELDDPVRPLADSSVPDDADICDVCGGDGVEYEEASDDDGDFREYEEYRAAKDLIDAGKCPWCDDYEGDHVASHASSAHPNAWTEYKN